MFQSALSCFDGNPKVKSSHPEKNFVKCCSVISKLVTDKHYQFSFLFSPLTIISPQNLSITRLFNLGKEFYAILFCSFTDEEMSSYILGDMVYTVEIVIIFTIHFDVFFIIVLSPFQHWFNFEVQWILKKVNIFLSIG